MSKWKTESSLEEMIPKLPDKQPPAELRKKIMRALPEYKEPLIKRMLRLINTSPFGYRAAVVAASLVLTFYGGMQFDRIYQADQQKLNEWTAAQEDMSSEALFYFGRSLLATGKSMEALNAFSKAELLQPDNPHYSLWKGKAYSAMGALEEELQTYSQLVIKWPDLLPARLHLADSLLRSGEALQAQRLYEQILVDYPKEKTALYKRAVALREQGNTAGEAEALRSYLDFYRTEDSASEVLVRLNDLGDYSFRKYQLGPKTVILNQNCLLDHEGHSQKLEVEHLVRYLKNNALGKVSIVVFVQNDAQQAKTIAQSLHKAIAETGESLENSSVGFSWFDAPEPLVSPNRETISLSKGVLIFSTPKDSLNKENTI